MFTDIASHNETGTSTSTAPAGPDGRCSCSPAGFLGTQPTNLLCQELTDLPIDGRLSRIVFLGVRMHCDFLCTLDALDKVIKKLTKPDRELRFVYESGRYTGGGRLFWVSRS